MIVKKICTLIYFSAAVVAILDFGFWVLDLPMFYHQTEYGNGFHMSENMFYSGSYNVR